MQEELWELIEKRQEVMNDLVKLMYECFGDLIGIIHSIKYLEYLKNKTEIKTSDTK